MSKTKFEVCERGATSKVTLSEAKDGLARFRVRLISPGQGSSGYYSREVIENSGPEAFAKGTHMHINHQSFEDAWKYPAGDLRTLAGVIDSTPVYEADNPDGEGLYADALVFSRDQQFLTEAAPYIGLSIRAAADKEEGPSPETGEITDIITSFVAGISVDYVTHPGRDGRITSTKEAQESRTKIVEILEHNTSLLPDGAILVEHKNPTGKEPVTKVKGKPMAELTNEAAQALTDAVLKQNTLLEAAAKRAEDADKAEQDRIAAEGRIDPLDVVATVTEALIKAKILSQTSVGRVVESLKVPGVKLEDAIKKEQELQKEFGVTEGGNGQVYSITEGASKPAGSSDWESKFGLKVAN